MSTTQSVLYTLKLHVRGRKTKNQTSAEVTIDQRDKKMYNINPGDILTAQIIEHKRGDEE